MSAATVGVFSLRTGVESRNPKLEGTQFQVKSSRMCVKRTTGSKIAVRVSHQLKRVTSKEIVSLSFHDFPLLFCLILSPSLPSLNWVDKCIIIRRKSEYINC